MQEKVYLFILQILMFKLRVSRTKHANLQVSPNKFCCIS